MLVKSYYFLGCLFDWKSDSWHPPTHLVLLPVNAFAALYDKCPSDGFSKMVEAASFYDSVMKLSQVLDIRKLIPKWDSCLSFVKDWYNSEGECALDSCKSGLCDIISQDCTYDNEVDFVCSLALSTVYEDMTIARLVKHQGYWQYYSEIFKHSEDNSSVHIRTIFFNIDTRSIPVEIDSLCNLDVNVVVKLNHYWYTVGNSVGKYGGYSADCNLYPCLQRSNMLVRSLVDASLDSSDRCLINRYMLGNFFSVDKKDSISQDIQLFGNVRVNAADMSDYYVDMLHIHLTDCGTLKSDECSVFYKLNCKSIFIDGDGLNRLTCSSRYFAHFRVESDLDLSGHLAQVRNFSYTFSDEGLVKAKDASSSFIGGELKLPRDMSHVKQWANGFSKLTCSLLDLRGTIFSPDASFVGLNTELELTSIFSSFTCKCLRINADSFKTVSPELLFGKFSGKVEVYGLDAAEFVANVKDACYPNGDFDIEVGTTPAWVLSTPSIDEPTLDLSDFESGVVTEAADLADSASEVQSKVELDDDDMYIAVAFRLSNDEDSASGIAEIGFIPYEALASVDFVFNPDDIIYKPVSELTARLGDSDETLPADEFLSAVFLDQSMSSRCSGFSACPVLHYMDSTLVSYSRLLLSYSKQYLDTSNQHSGFNYIMDLGRIFILTYDCGELIASLLAPRLATMPDSGDWISSDGEKYYSHLFYTTEQMHRLHRAMYDYVVTTFCSSVSLTNTKMTDDSFLVHYVNREDKVCVVPDFADAVDSATLVDAVVSNTRDDREYKLFLPSNVKGVFGNNVIHTGDSYVSSGKMSIHWTPVMTGYDDLGWDDTGTASPILRHVFNKLTSAELDNIDISYAQDISGLFANLGNIPLLDLSEMKFTKHSFASGFFNNTRIEKLIIPPEFGYCASSCMLPSGDRTARSPIASADYIASVSLVGIKVNKSLNYNFYLDGAIIGSLEVDAEDFIELPNWEEQFFAMLLTVSSFDITVYAPRTESALEKFNRVASNDIFKAKIKVVC